jgi:16S rRNA (cytidine1402-2'-O)-methyltransferase
MIAALSVSGFDAQRFSFGGFLPRKPGKKRKALDELLQREETFVLYEGPHRVVALLQELAERAPLRRVALCRELTKQFEETVRGTAAEVAHLWAERRETRGEFVLVVDAAGNSQDTDEA